MLISVIVPYVFGYIERGLNSVFKATSLTKKSKTCKSKICLLISVLFREILFGCKTIHSRRRNCRVSMETESMHLKHTLFKFY